MSVPPRYAPPRSEVGDIPAADDEPRPRSVVWAVALMLASAVVSIVSALPAIDPPIVDEPVAMTLLVWAVTLALAGLELWLLRCVWQRRDWARWCVLALTALALVLTVANLEDDWLRSPVVAALAWASAAMSALAAALLLVPPSARWFRSRPTR